MNMETLETFLSLCRLKSFTKTSESLFVAQSTVTNRMMELEKEIGHPLFFRNNKGLTMTEAGKAYYEYAAKIVELHKNAIACLNENGFSRKKIRIGTTNTIYECHVKKKLVDLSVEAGDLSWKVIIGHSQELLELLQADSLDYAYTYVPMRKKSYVCECFSVDELVLVCHYDNVDYKDGIYQEQLPMLRYLYCDFALQGVGIFVKQLFPQYYQFSFEIDNSTKLLDYILKGAGYSFLPLSLVKPLIEEQKIRVIPLLDFETPKINNYFVGKTKKDPLGLLGSKKNVYASG
ncbi:MAG: LysR family transcriptional regulator [Blautia sp.]|jgi:LysR family transcriptional repressor of citA